MASQAVFLLVEPSHFEVNYRINPWMEPELWQRDAARQREAAQHAYTLLSTALRNAGCLVLHTPGVPGLPDMVFTANAAIVHDRRALLARFRFAQRQAEETAYLKLFQDLCAQGVLREVAQLPVGCFQEGAGDCIWDETRKLFWGGYGPRSRFAALAQVQDFFDVEVVPMELASERCYHLDVCFRPLAGGEVLYYPPALTEAARAQLEQRVAPGLLIEADEEDLRHFSVNAVNLGHRLIMNRTTERLRQVLRARGYETIEIDLSPFMLSGGGAYCLTLRLDQGEPETSFDSRGQGPGPDEGA